MSSIQNQTDENWELIAVNDHSEDDSLQILKNWAFKESRIKVLQNNGNGIIPALRTAYRASKGQFIHRMDADDLMVKDKLWALKNLLLKHGEGFISTAKVQYFAKDGVSDGYYQYQKWLNKLCDQNNHWEEIYKECVIASPCWMMHRKDLDQVGAFDSAIYPEDYDLIFRCYRSNLKVVSLDKVLHLWRDHALRTSRNHKHYQQNAFFEIKLHYFLALEYTATNELIIWGAGRKGKTLAKLLQSRNIPFEWVSNNPNKHDQKIYDQVMKSYEYILKKEQPKIIITVAQRNAKEEISCFLKKNNLAEGKDFYFFR